MKNEIDSILLANWYFIKCKISNSSGKKVETARKQLFEKVKVALKERHDLIEEEQSLAK